jgi:imidazolonepropionase-like amidohydrolase
MRNKGFEGVQKMTRPRIFHNLALFDGASPELQADRWLEVARGRIRRVGQGPHPEDGDAVDLGGRTVIPGLIDAHVHILNPFLPDLNLGAMRSITRQIKLNLALCIRSGVTTVRDMGGPPGMVQRVKRWVREGKAPGPRIVGTNSFITCPGGYPEYVPVYSLPFTLLVGGQFAERASAPDAVRALVRRMVAKGSDWIKTAHSDRSIWLNRPDPLVFDDACFEALVDEAHRQERPVAMHQTWATGFRKAIELGVDSIEHTPWDALADEDIRWLVEAGIPIVPTLYVFLTDPQKWLAVEGERYYCPESLAQTKELWRLYRDERVTPEMTQQEYFLDWDLIRRALPVIRENAARLVRAGPTIGFGTDSGGSQFAVFGRFYEEADNLVQAGLTALDVLRSATGVNARILRLEDRLGTLEPGKLADLVVLDGDPLVDLAALRQVRMVVKEGRIVHREGM